MKSSFIFLLTFIVALMLEALPFPDDLVWFRPEWALLVVLYWVIALPYKVGVGVAWFLGLMVDLLQGGIIGQHSLTYVIIAYACALFYQRLRMYMRWQQGVFIFLLVSINQLVNFWLDHYVGNAEPTLMIFMPAIITGFLWPWSFVVLRSIRRLYSIS
ncbi:rod shape-determining protein MreD [Marinomonas mediterranea]|jgi:rod shape-determining protein MreD|uniref:Rod shape-determining protein MreD n=1 Tax=Marinomonas mediterranea (strain ATCC 700492 / JCM 21426 / NBRC 103028 / MMB-1) TaxID=717774 RepID=F2K191_MARM1|nr:rod shape-determining protein MreD [Marinomonas mediterranea]ADZ91022.1 rod shape-determining protein MreD [Marinomonas mediterranea MMB-1]WCN09059.1 rod shape-determining protein MreD [Marinomonas mediterranea]WCN13090.1 rod shape-determining protein MreD [Marinomonas mediterranea]WCN17161.1 rod shape-determining protein MreD [Marinomonas mediterranea MMB-1]